MCLILGSIFSLIYLISSVFSTMEISSTRESLSGAILLKDVILNTLQIGGRVTTPKELVSYLLRPPNDICNEQGRLLALFFY